MLTILIIIVCVCNLHASEHDILGQSPRSAEIVLQYPRVIWWISGSIQPTTMIPRANEEFRNTTLSTKEVLTTSYQSSVGFTHRWNKHTDMAVSIGFQVNAHHLYIPISVEGRVFPFRNKVNPFLYMGFGGMISREFGLFGSRGFGINSQISKYIHFEIHYKEIRGDIFMFSPDNPMQLSMKQKGVQTTVYFIL